MLPLNRAAPADPPVDLFADPDTGFIVVAALRYTIGRRSYAPGLVADWLRRYWHRLRPGDRQTLRRDVEEAVRQYERSLPGGDLESASDDLRAWSAGSLGDACDREVWYALRDWMRQDEARAGTGGGA